MSLPGQFVRHCSMGRLGSHHTTHKYRVSWRALVSQTATYHRWYIRGAAIAAEAAGFGYYLKINSTHSHNLTCTGIHHCDAWPAGTVSQSADYGLFNSQQTRLRWSIQQPASQPVDYARIVYSTVSEQTMLGWSI